MGITEGVRKIVKRVMLYGLLAVFLVGIYFVSDSIDYLKKPLVGKDNVQQHMGALEKCLLDRKWGQAAQELKEIESAWNKVQKRIQFAGESDDIQKMDEMLVRMEAAIRIKSYDIANTDMASLKFHWGHVGK